MRRVLQQVKVFDLVSTNMRFNASSILSLFYEEKKKNNNFGF